MNSPDVLDTTSRLIEAPKGRARTLRQAQGRLWGTQEREGRELVDSLQSLQVAEGADIGQAEGEAVGVLVAYSP